jgi:hypothetical protein
LDSTKISEFQRCLGSLLEVGENQEHGGAETEKSHNPHRRLRPILGRKRHGFSGLGVAPAEFLSFLPVAEPPVSVEPRNVKHSEECEPLHLVQHDEHFAGVSFSSF